MSVERFEDVFEWDESGPKVIGAEGYIEVKDNDGNIIEYVTLGEEKIDLTDKSAATHKAALNYTAAVAEEALIRATLTAADVKKAAINEAMVALRTEMQNQLNVMRGEINQIDENTYDARKALREAVIRVDQMQRLLRQALENEMALARFKDNSLEFDKATFGLSWREFAYPHQIDGGKYMAANQRIILGDKMGLGKSLTSLIACDMLRSQRVLIIVPDDIVGNFVHEVARWAPHRNVTSLGKVSKEIRHMMITMLSALTSYVVVVNYSAWRKDKSLIASLIDCRFDTIIMDEAHTIKETTTNAYKGCKSIALAENICPECMGPTEHISLSYQPSDYREKRDYTACKDNATCEWSTNRDRVLGIHRDYFDTRSAKNVFPMTGTAILNKPTDLFALLSLIDPMHFVEKYKFEADYCDKDYYTGKIKFRAGGMNSLVKRLSGKWLARDRQSAGVVLPKQEIIEHRLVLDELLYPAQLKVIQQLTKFATIQLTSGKQMTAIAAIALITRKRQANAWPAGIVQKDPLTGDIVFSVADDVNESIKVDWCCDPNGEGSIVDMCADGNMVLGDRVVVFSQFKGPLKELELRLNAAGISAVRLDGDTPENIRDQIKFDFDRSRCNVEGYEKKWQVVLCNFKTGGQGLNFNDATQMVILDEEWNAGKNDQAYGRMDRIGQTEETTVHVLRLEGTIDTWMQDLIQAKREMVDGFESSADLAQAFMQALGNGEML